MSANAITPTITAIHVPHGSLWESKRITTIRSVRRKKPTCLSCTFSSALAPPALGGKSTPGGILLFLNDLLSAEDALSCGEPPLFCKVLSGGDALLAIIPGVHLFLAQYGPLNNR